MKMISIILPVYNVEKYIMKCVHSIIDQTCKNFELIIIDDCGTDNSINICRDELNSSSVKHKIITNRVNMGLSQSRNIGVESSKSKYVLFIDSDDWIAPDTLETMLKTAVENNAEIVSCNAQEYWEETNSFSDLPHPKKTVYSGEDYLTELFNSRTNILSVAWAKLINRELLISIKFPAGVTYEDILTVPFILRRANVIIHINRSLYFYVKRENSKSIVNSRPENIHGYLICLGKLKNAPELVFDKDKSGLYWFVYRNLLLITYSAVNLSGRYLDIRDDMRSIRHFIKLKDICHFFSDNLKHTLYLLLLKLSSPLYFYVYKASTTISRIGRTK